MGAIGGSHPRLRRSGISSDPVAYQRSSFINFSLPRSYPWMAFTLYFSRAKAIELAWPAYHLWMRLISELCRCKHVLQANVRSAPHGASLHFPKTLLKLKSATIYSC
jgi:hypothetical protein